MIQSLSIPVQITSTRVDKVRNTIAYSLSVFKLSSNINTAFTKWFFNYFFFSIFKYEKEIANLRLDVDELDVQLHEEKGAKEREVDKFK